MINIRFSGFSLLALLFILAGCQVHEKSATTPQQTFDTAPVLSLQESLTKMKVEDGFEIIPVAAEPLVSSPVALTFDHKGRMWVVEMQGYMPDEEGSGEETPNGKIVILNDNNADGIADERKVFMDSLVLPRSICLIENGILVAEPPRLWYVEINNDKPGKKTLVDSAYTEGDNIEGQANGLYRAMDNWIYNTGSEKRYRRKGNGWVTERAHLRGQWGVSQDNFGRLFYNNNSQNLLGDFFSPGLGANNINQQHVAGFNEKIVTDNRVYPSRPTPGVNRGYQEGILDAGHRLINLTAASGPVIYRGDLFAKEYQLNAFVGEPAANLIKRNILQEKGNFVEGKQAYEGKEFLTSTDERFRPVTLYNGPDGALYVVDMYRGIIEHKSFLTKYLEDQIKERKLEQPVNCGRIYKIIPKNSKPALPVLQPNDPQALVSLLQHPNGWVRDKAQQMLIDGKFFQALPDLRKLLENTQNPVAVCHSLWTIEGLGLLQPSDVLPLLKNADWQIRMPALSVLPEVSDKNSYKLFATAFKAMISQNDSLAAPYIAFQINAIQPFDNALANDLLLTIANKYPQNEYVADAIISNLNNKEAGFYTLLNAANADSSLLIKKRLKKVMKDIENQKNNQDNILLQRKFPRGARVFKAICQACHKADGSGIPSLAPPLNHSEWVVGDKNKLIAIVLFGLVGPVEVNGKLYKAPEINGDMPPIGNNKDIVAEDIAQLLNYIRNSWNNKAELINIKDVQKVRKQFSGRQSAFTAEELKSLK